jgi:hypothetical protein
MNKNSVFILEDRGILYVSGKDAKEFLQNIISNDIGKVSKNYSCFSSLLTPQGKFLFDFIIIKHKSGYFLDCEKKNIDQLYKQLSLYKLRSEVELMNLSNEYVVAAISKERFLSFDNAQDLEGKTTYYTEDPIFLDPRHKDLGARLIINLEKLYLSIKKLELKVDDANKYYSLSYDLGIPQKDTNQLQNKIFGIECNLEELNGIDFKKGCYVGQENTARIKLKDKLLKRLFPIKVTKGSFSNEEKIFFEKKEVGKILIKNDFPFAIIKYRDKDFDFENQYICGDATIKIIKPNWIN